MKACKHFSLEFGETDIIQSEGYPWNAYVVVWQGDKKVYSSFETGLFWNYLKHLAENKECRKEVGRTKKQVITMLKEIKEEWKKVTG